MRKKVQIVLLFICIGYLAVISYTVGKSPNNTKSELDLETQVDNLAVKNIDIADSYKKKANQGFNIEEEIVKKREELLKEVIALENQQTDDKKTPEFSKSMSALKNMHSSLNESYPNITEYIQFLQRSSPKLFELKEKQLRAWEDIETALEKYEPKHDKKDITRSPEDQVYAEKYNHFISDLRGFLESNRVFAEDKSNLDTLLNKYNKYVSGKSLSVGEKEAMFTSILASCILREIVSVTFNCIDITKNNGFTNPSIDLFNCSMPNPLVIKASELEKKEYQAQDKLQGIPEILESIFSRINDLVCNKIDILEVKTQKLQAAIKYKHTELANDIKALVGRQNSSSVKSIDRLREKIDKLLEYKDAVTRAVLKTIEIDVYTTEQEEENAGLFSLESLSMADEALDMNTIIGWFEVQCKPQKINNTAVKNADHKWLEKVQLNFDVSETERKAALGKFDQILKNIDAIMNTLFYIIDQVLDKRNFQRQINILNNTDGIVQLFIYAAKIKKLKTLLKCEIPSYLLCALKYIEKYKANMGEEYSVLNQKSFLRIRTVLKDIILALSEKRGQQLLKHLQLFIKQLNRSTSKIGFLLSNKDFKKQDDLAKKLYSIKVEQELNPSKAFPLTEHVRLQTKDAIKKIVLDMQEITEIKSKEEFYCVRRNVMMFDRALEILEQYIAKDAEETLKVFTDYRSKNIAEELKSLREEEKTANIRESKKAFVECETIIVDAYAQFEYLLSQICSRDFQGNLMTSIYNDDSDSIFEIIDSPVSGQASKAAQLFSNRKYLIIFIVVMFVALTGAGIYFFAL